MTFLPVIASSLARMGNAESLSLRRKVAELTYHSDRDPPTGAAAMGLEKRLWELTISTLKTPPAKKPKGVKRKAGLKPDTAKIPPFDHFQTRSLNGRTSGNVELDDSISMPQEESETCRTATFGVPEATSARSDLPQSDFSIDQQAFTSSIISNDTPSTLLEDFLGASLQGTTLEHPSLHLSPPSNLENPWIMDTSASGFLYDYRAPAIQTWLDRDTYPQAHVAHLSGISENLSINAGKRPQSMFEGMYSQRYH